MAFIRAASGFTLLEIVIALFIIGVATTLVAPALLAPPAETESDAERVIAAARRAAIERAEPVTLVISPAGDWSLSARTATSRAGRIAWPHAADLRLHISPLGACTVAAASAGAPVLRIDPVHCRLLQTIP